ncbi:SGNH/GDSL hydrolase family protein [Endozoicomonas sp. SM1973]|uniref:SGNH/GDSL hydrolase family protein n=1 Tax=Spartinivicinus marinus TaxID=2994442 RepID=A0A853I3L5_9GAMM|nr:SGNH/GDSL hydrolase family protein [Spartinivicinus marinus]MCX4027267.1 SGNH/GDSL hydrolase family protein [Spartinivicinus marinus]NYZ67973.1 SGNH/GDSL hydrolase family protein [Spartinivicinus marinus]
MKKLIRLSVIAVLLFSATQLSAKEQVSISRIVIFGDSLSDTGKMYKKSKGWLPSSPPYYTGRFADGPVWVDYIKEAFQKKAIDLTIINESEGGATAAAYEKESYNPTYQVINNLEHEVEQFLENNKFQSSDLVIIWAGANDYVTNNWRDTDRVMLAIDQTISQALIGGAAQVLVINIPKLNITPFSNYYDNTQSADLENISTKHNQELIRLMSTRNPDKVRLFDVASELKEIIQNAASLGFTNTDQACYTKGYIWHPFIKGKSKQYAHSKSLIQYDYYGLKTEPKKMEELNRYELRELFENDPNFSKNPMLHDALPSGQQMSLRERDTFNRQGNSRLIDDDDSTMARSIDIAGNAPDNCDGYLFWDKVHPTTAAHQVLADRLYSFFELYYTLR